MVQTDDSDGRQGFARRLRQALSDSGYPERGAAVRLAGELAPRVSERAVGKWLNAESMPDTKRLDQISRLVRRPVEWLLTGREMGDTSSAPSAEEYAEIPQYDARGSCGNGHLNDHVEVRGSLAFKRDWLMRMGLTPATLAVINAQGDSMAPTINDGAVLLIDHGRQAIEDGRVYAVLWDGELVVKRLFRELGGRLRVVSDNPDKTRYPDRKVEPDESELLEIIGRVVWQSGTL